jgi:hypothetical protein
MILVTQNLEMMNLLGLLGRHHRYHHLVLQKLWKSYRISDVQNLEGVGQGTKTNPIATFERAHSRSYDLQQPSKRSKSM